MHLYNILKEIQQNSRRQIQAFRINFTWPRYNVRANWKCSGGFYGFVKVVAVCLFFSLGKNFFFCKTLLCIEHKVHNFNYQVEFYYTFVETTELRLRPSHFLILFMEDFHSKSTVQWLVVWIRRGGEDLPCCTFITLFEPTARHFNCAWCMSMTYTIRSYLHFTIFPYQQVTDKYVRNKYKREQCGCA